MCNLKYFTKEIEKGCFSKFTEALKPRCELIFCCQTAKENIFRSHNPVSFHKSALLRKITSVPRKILVGKEKATIVSS